MQRTVLTMQCVRTGRLPLKKHSKGETKLHRVVCLLMAAKGPQHLHYQVNTAIGELIEVTLDHAANVLMMTTMQYDNYKVRFTQRFPFEFLLPTMVFSY